MNKLALAVSLAALAVGGGAFAQAMMGDKDITRAEAQARSSEMFARMDANKDGLLNDADREARLAQRFDGMDADKNGAISRDEFMAGHAGKHGMEGHEGMQMGKPDGMEQHKGHMGGGHGGWGKMHGMGGKHAMMMKAADQNGDGSVSATEFAEAHLAMFDKGDTNKDGTLTADERKAAMEAMKAQMEAAPTAAPPAAAK